MGYDLEGGGGLARLDEGGDGLTWRSRDEKRCFMVGLGDDNAG